MTYILYIMAFIYLFLPLQFALSPFPGIDLAVFRVCVVIITLCFLCISLVKKNIFIPLGFVSAFFSAFFMWIFFSAFISPVPFWTLRKILFFVTLFPLFYILTTFFVKKTQSIQIILQSIVYGGLIVSLVSIIQFFLQFFISLNKLLSFWGAFTPFFLGHTFSESVITHNSWLVHVGSHDLMRAIAFFPDPHMFSFYLGMIAPFSLFLFSSTQKQKWIFAFLVILCADLLTFSRGGYIGLLFGITTGIIFFWNNLSAKIKRLTMLILLFCFFIILVPQNPITQRFVSSFSLVDHSVTHRIELWSESIAEIKKRPFLGTGLGAYSYTINPHADYRTPIYVHNLFLDIAVELGLPGLFLFINIFFAMFFIFYKKKEILTRFAIISVSIFIGHSFFDTALFSVHVIPILLFIFAIASYYENSSRT
ncbi:MAG: hypothetical protein CR972_00550 [Candidatus Moraniibacteriota bacterium]|nr:MAG: hypothetical protein CR972_00550 [Candidatus Moranbacteria bacterium]